MNFLSVKPCLLFACCLLLTVTAWAQDKPYHGDGPDDVLQHVPMTAVLVLKAAGVKSNHDWPQLLAGAGLSYLLTAGATYTLKHTLSERRPDGTDHRSLPSGHAAFAFSGATVLHKEFGHVSPWISVAGYTVAAATAVDRVCRNRHHWYDVVAGAGVGVLSTELSYFITRKILPDKKIQMEAALSPSGLHLVVMW